MRARRQFRVTETTWYPDGSEQITLKAHDENAVDGDEPTGSLTFRVTNPDLLRTFAAGALYNIDISPADEAESEVVDLEGEGSATAQPAGAPGY